MVHLPVNSFSPPSPVWGQHGCNALRPAYLDAPSEAGVAQQHTGDRLTSTEHLKGTAAPQLWAFSGSNKHCS